MVFDTFRRYPDEGGQRNSSERRISSQKGYNSIPSSERGGITIFLGSHIRFLGSRTHFLASLTNFLGSLVVFLASFARFLASSMTFLGSRARFLGSPTWDRLIFLRRPIIGNCSLP